MNKFDVPANDDLRFDRLVDGELSDAERRRLLASLDDEPGGWQCCALAFLEAQAWRQTMQVVPQRGDSARADPWQGTSKGQLPKPAQPTPQSGSNGDGHDDVAADRPSLVRLVLAMAACFLVAFFLGSEFRQRWATDARPPSPLAQQQIPAATTFPTEEAPPAIEAQSPTTTIIPWGEATFVMDGDEGREVDVSVFDLDPYARQVLLEKSTAAFDDLRRDLQRGGFDVQRRVRWSPVEMPGGHQMFVPVGDFEILPVSQRAIQ